MNNNNKFLREGAAGAMLLVLSIFIMVTGRELGQKASMFPELIALLLGVFSVVLVTRSAIIHSRQRKSQPRNKNTGGKTPDLSFLLVLALALLYLKFHGIIGFEIAAFLLVLSIMTFIERRLRASRLLIAALVSIILALVFAGGLQLRIPLLISRLF